VEGELNDHIAGQTKPSLPRNQGVYVIYWPSWILQRNRRLASLFAHHKRKGSSVPFSKSQMPIKTRGDLLRGELAFALAKGVKIVRGLRRIPTYFGMGA
jgi:hypothetical protein